MELRAVTRRLADEIISEYNLPKEQTYNFISDRIKWAIGIGYDVGRSHRSRVEKIVVKMNMQGKTLQVYTSLISASRLSNVNKSDISKVCLEKRKSAGGYKWRFLDPNDYFKYRKIQ